MEPMRALFLDTTRGAYSAPKCSYINKKATAKQNNSLELVINLVSQSIVLRVDWEINIICHLLGLVNAPFLYDYKSDLSKNRAYFSHLGHPYVF